MALLFGSGMVGQDCRVGMVYLRTDVPVDSWRLELHEDTEDTAWPDVPTSLLWEGRPPPGEWVKVPLQGRFDWDLAASAVQDGAELFRDESVANILAFGVNIWLRFDGEQLHVDEIAPPDGAPYDLRRLLSDGIYLYGPILIGPVRISDMLSCVAGKGIGTAI